MQKQLTIQKSLSLSYFSKQFKYSQKSNIKAQLNNENSNHYSDRWKFLNERMYIVITYLKKLQLQVLWKAK